MKLYSLSAGSDEDDIDMILPRSVPKSDAGKASIETSTCAPLLTKPILFDGILTSAISIAVGTIFNKSSAGVLT